MSLQIPNEILEIKNEIAAIENCIVDKNLVKFFSETKKTAILYLAEKYERLAELGASEVMTNQIANFLVKKFRSLGVKIADSTIYDNMPKKYKLHKQNPDFSEEIHSENRSENSSLQEKEFCTFEAENNEFLHYWEDHLDTVKIIISKLKTNPYVSKMDYKEFSEDLKLLEFANRSVRDCFDDRVSLPFFAQHIALRVFAEEPAKYAGHRYVQKIKEFGGFQSDEATNNLMSFKQFRKLLTGKIKDIRDLYVPKSKDEAMTRGYYGMRCTDMQCKSWRVFYEPLVKQITIVENGKNVKKDIMKNMCKCYACDKVMEPITESLPKESPGITIEWHSR